MNDLARQKLREILMQYGCSVCDDPRRVRALLADHCPDLKREVHLLAFAAEQRVAAELATASTAVPWSALSGRLVRRLVDELAVAEDAARWAVESWAVALGRISSGDHTLLNCIVQETERPRPTPARRGKGKGAFAALGGLVCIAGVAWAVVWRAGFERHQEPPVSLQTKVKPQVEKNQPEQQVPPETRLKEFKVELQTIDKDIQRQVHKLAVLVDEVNGIKANITAMRDTQAKQREEIAAMSKALEGSNETVSYNHHNYTQVELLQKLNQAVTSYNRQKAELKARESVLAQKQDARDKSTQRIKAMLQQKDELRVAVAELEARIETLKMTQVDKPIDVDHSQVNKCNELLEKARNLLAQQEKADQLREKFGITQPTTEPSERTKSKDEILQDVKKALDDDEQNATADKK